MDKKSNHILLCIIGLVLLLIEFDDDGPFNPTKETLQVREKCVPFVSFETLSCFPFASMQDSDYDILL